MKALLCILAFIFSASAFSQGYIKPRNWQRMAKWNDMRSVLDKEPLPAAFDWNDHATLQPIRNQANCGSCWAFSVTAVVESLHMIAHGSPFHAIDLAEQTLVSSCSSAGSCRGGFFNAFNYIQKTGLPDEAQDPYKARNSSCKSGLIPEQKIKEWHYVGQSNRQPTTDEIKAAVIQFGPNSVDINGSFGSYRGGVYTNCGSTSPNHMVNIEGWKDDSAYAAYGGGYWIMRNSWGKNWGENGYMRIVYKSRRGSKCNGIGGVTAYAVLPEAPEGVRELIQ